MTPMQTTSYSAQVAESQKGSTAFLRDAIKSYQNRRPQRESNTIDLLREAQSGNGVAMEQLVYSNLPLVVSIANQFSGRGVEFDDLIIEGYLGLRKSILEYNIEKYSNSQLSTYATWWITTKMQRAIQNSGVVRIPIWLREHINRAFTRLSKLENQPTETLSEEEKQFLTFAPQERAKMTQYLHPPTSLYSPFGEDGKDGFFLLDSIADEQDPYAGPDSYEHQEIEQQRRTLLQESLKRLDPRQQQLIDYYYLSPERHTMEECAKRFNISRERIRQILVKTLSQLSTHTLLQEHARETLDMAALPQKLPTASRRKNGRFSQQKKKA